MRAQLWPHHETSLPFAPASHTIPPGTAVKRLLPGEPTGYHTPVLFMHRGKIGAPEDLQLTARCESLCSRAAVAASTDEPNSFDPPRAPHVGRRRTLPAADTARKACCKAPSTALLLTSRGTAGPPKALHLTARHDLPWTCPATAKLSNTATVRSSLALQPAAESGGEEHSFRETRMRTKLWSSSCIAAASGHPRPFS